MSVAEQVETYVRERPYVQEALAAGIVNFSALARTAQDEVDGGFEAVKVALRRLADDIQEERGERAESVGDVLDETSITLRSNVTVCMTETVHDAAIGAETESGYTGIHTEPVDCGGETLPDQVLLTLHSPRDLEQTPGVLAYLLQLFAGHNINITEFISCRENTHIVVHEDDATDAFTLLDEKLS